MKTKIFVSVVVIVVLAAAYWLYASPYGLKFGLRYPIDYGECANGGGTMEPRTFQINEEDITYYICRYKDREYTIQYEPF